MTDPQGFRSTRPANRGGLRQERRWPTYVGITGLLVFIIVALAGGIIWYNAKKSSELAIASAQRLMKEADKKIIDRIRLLYDPMSAIVGVGSMVPDLTTPSVADDPKAEALMMRALRLYSQILSLYVGFDKGDFFMVTHIAGDKAADLRKALQAPPDAVFANEIVTTDDGSQNDARWVFLGENGAVVGRRDRAAALDPRQRPWYGAAKAADAVERSDLYIFASSGEPGFTLSRRFGGPTPGVMGADFAVVDLAKFLNEQRITPNSTAFVFTKSGEVVALPDEARIVKAVHANGKIRAMLPKIADLNDPVINGLVAAYRNQQMAGTRVFDVNGRTYIGRVVNIPPRYGRDELFGIAVPVDEIEQPITEIRNDTLLYSVAFLVFALPLYVILVIIWIDRKLERHSTWLHHQS